MPTSAECVCCREISAVVAKIGELGATSVVCITLHPGLPPCVSMCYYSGTSQIRNTNQEKREVPLYY